MSLRHHSLWISREMLLEIMGNLNILLQAVLCHGRVSDGQGALRKWMLTGFSKAMIFQYYSHFCRGHQKQGKPKKLLQPGETSSVSIEISNETSCVVCHTTIHGDSLKAEDTVLVDTTACLLLPPCPLACCMLQWGPGRIFIF